jgi:hypothetical protein
MVVNAAHVQLPTKDALKLRDGKEIQTSSNMMDLNARFAELLQEE